MTPADSSLEIEQITVTAGGVTKSGEIKVRILSLPYRLFKTFGVALIWVFITIVNVLTPLLHFVTVPLSILATVYFTIKTFKVRKKISSGSAICPHCTQTFNTMTGSYKFPIKDTCTNCNKALVLNRP